MKKIKKLSFLLVSALLLTAMLSACSNKGSDNNGTADVTKGATNEETKGADESTTAAKITGVYLSPAKMFYSNMRPTYNYYLTTVNDQKLTTYDDGTYCLTVSSTQFSAIVLPEEGNDFSANERTNYMKDFYGTYTQVTDDLDSDLVNITLSAPTRITDAHDAAYYVDTANWTDAMGTTITELRKSQAAQYSQYSKDANNVTQGEIKPLTAEDFLADNSFKEVTIPATISTNSIEYTDLGLDNPGQFQ